MIHPANHWTNPEESFMKVVLDDVERQTPDSRGWVSQADRGARDLRVLAVFALLTALSGLAGFLLAVFA